MNATTTGVPSLDTIQIRQYQPEDHAEVIKLFAEGFDGFINTSNESFIRNYIAKSSSGDLEDINGTYLAAGGNFWVAIDTESSSGKIVGMVALERSDDKGELRRMSVHSAYRRCGLGRQLVNHLEQWAEANGINCVVLTTGGLNKHAMKFYEAMDYERTHPVVVCEANPRIEAWQFVKQLK